MAFFGCLGISSTHELLLGLLLVWMLGGEYTTISAPLGAQVIGPKVVGQALFTLFIVG